jgi:hypothetical protein
MKPTLEQWLDRRRKMNGIRISAERIGSGVSTFITVANGRAEITGALWIGHESWKSSKWRSVVAAKIREIRNTP